MAKKVNFLFGKGSRKKSQRTDRFSFTSKKPGLNRLDTSVRNVVEFNLNKRLRGRNMSLGRNKLYKTAQSLLVKPDELIKKNML
jgi:hypothetical protein